MENINQGNNFLIEKKQNLFSKVKNWFNNCFKKEKSIHITTSNIINENITDTKKVQKNLFIESLKTESQLEILNLQKKLKAGQIEISELTDEQLHKIIQLYEMQIQEKQNKLKKYQINNKKEE